MVRHYFIRPQKLPAADQGEVEQLSIVVANLLTKVYVNN
jgi:hypothetical protein